MIRARISTVTVSTMVATISTTCILLNQPYIDGKVTARLMGYWPVGLSETARSLFLTAILFAGPVFESLIVNGGWRDWVGLTPIKEVWSDLLAWRTIVVVCEGIPSHLYSQSMA